jgi:hypothetical protein
MVDVWVLIGPPGSRSVRRFSSSLTDALAREPVVHIPSGAVRSSTAVPDPLAPEPGSGGQSWH